MPASRGRTRMLNISWDCYRQDIQISVLVVFSLRYAQQMRFETPYVLQLLRLQWQLRLAEVIVARGRRLIP